MFQPKLKSVVSPVPEIIDWTFGWGLQTPNHGEEEAVVSKISNLCGPDPSWSQMDGRTDDVQSQYYSASRIITIAIY